MHKATLSILAKYLSEGYDLPPQLPQQQKRKWLKSLTWFVTPLVFCFREIWQHCVKRFWRWLFFVPYHQECQEMTELLVILSYIAEGKHPLSANSEYRR